MNHDTPAPLLHSIPDATMILGVGRSTVYKMIDDGQLDVVKLRKRTLVTDASIRRAATPARREKAA